MLDELTEDEEDVVEVAVFWSVAISLVLDFLAGTAFGVLAISTGIEDWLLDLVGNIF